MRGTQFIVGTQVATSCLLLIMAGLLVRAAMHTLHSNLGLRYEQVLAIDPDVGCHDFTTSRVEQYLDQMQRMTSNSSVLLNDEPKCFLTFAAGLSSHAFPAIFSARNDADL